MYISRVDRQFLPPRENFLIRHGPQGREIPAENLQVLARLFLGSRYGSPPLSYRPSNLSCISAMNMGLLLMAAETGREAAREEPSPAARPACRCSAFMPP